MQKLSTDAALIRMLAEVWLGEVFDMSVWEMYALSSQTSFLSPFPPRSKGDRPCVNQPNTKRYKNGDGKPTNLHYST